MSESTLLCGLDEDGGPSWDQEPQNEFEKGIKSLCTFCEVNWTGPNAENVSHLTDSSEVLSSLSRDGEEVRPTILNLQLIKNAIDIFDSISDESTTTLWWKMRCNHVHQRILEAPSPTLYNKSMALIEKLNIPKLEFSDSRLRTLLALETCQIYLFYGRTEKILECLNMAKDYEGGFQSDLTGLLGKRTKFQQNEVAQLALKLTVGEKEHRISSDESHGNSELPKTLELTDDVRLDKISFSNPDEQHFVNLTASEQLICLNEVQYLQHSQPKDNLANEELSPYIDILLNQKSGPWSARIATLLLKSKIESNNKRTVERSMMQCEEVVNSLQKDLPPLFNRLSYFWASGMPLMLFAKSLLADLMLSLGLVKGALDIYLSLQQWEEIIACYTILELRHKAAEVIRQQIEIKPTAKLYCLLGDQTDDVTFYEKAWEFSGQKSGLAQKHWGNYLFFHKKYEECIPHYEKSCEINSLREDVWLKLGYAALTTEKFDLAATAYRRYTYLEPHSFEAWNNLAKVYVKQGDKQRAHKALSEALKYNYDNWQIWENMIIVSVDTGHFDDVIRSYHRLLDLKKNYIDVEVLTLLVKAIVQNKNDADGNESLRLKPKTRELFGRITSLIQNNGIVWELYADISDDTQSHCHRLLKSCAFSNQVDSVDRNEKYYRRNLRLATDLGNSCLTLLENINVTNKGSIMELLSSTRLTIKAITSRFPEEFCAENKTEVDHLIQVVEEITNELKK